MRAMVLGCGRCFDVLCKGILMFAGAGLVLMSAAILWQVYGRFVRNDTPTWTEPVALLLMLYFILLAAAVGIRERSHLGLDLVFYVVPRRVAIILDGIIAAVVALLGFAMLVYGYRLVGGTWNERIPAILLPEGVRFIPMCLAGLLIGVFSIEKILRLALGIDVPHAAQPVEGD
ncbi:MAG: TRAP transporter small permease [Planctomycetes bacterium]|nr:TRAP transporter small permease [Planctomycetota bacterium]